MPAHRTRGMTDVNPRQLELCSAPKGEFLKIHKKRHQRHQSHRTHQRFQEFYEQALFRFAQVCHPLLYDAPPRPRLNQASRLAVRHRWRLLYLRASKRRHQNAQEKGQWRAGAAGQAQEHGLRRPRACCQHRRIAPLATLLHTLSVRPWWRASGRASARSSSSCRRGAPSCSL